MKPKIKKPIIYTIIAVILILIILIKVPETTLGLVALAFLGLVYFLPTIIGRKKDNATAIFILNLLLGWSIIGWIIAMVWACTKDKGK